MRKYALKNCLVHIKNFTVGITLYTWFWLVPPIVSPIRTAIRYFLHTSMINTWLSHRNFLTGPCFQVNFLLPYSLLWSRPNNKIIWPCSMHSCYPCWQLWFTRKILEIYLWINFEINLSQILYFCKTYFITEYFNNSFHTYCFILWLTMRQF